ncbi:hypothetical protein SH668x_002742 [Planctomicrobium sp. SH668]|uniref:hypothetical protein n=1 Tax=Planctomicrobium sp. SH668 TaxID=3448126 RepID=UPI003F5C5DEB
MPMLPVPGLLAAVESFIFSVFMVIAFAGWLINLINQSQPGAKKPNRRPNQQNQNRPKPAQKSVQEEIERFLTQARQAAEQQRPQPQRDQFPNQNSDGIEVVSRGPKVENGGQRPSPSKQQQPKRKSVVAPNQQSKKKNQSQPVAKPPQPQIGNRTLASSERVSPLVTRQVGSEISSNLQPHLGSFSAVSSDSFGEKGIASTTQRAETPASRMGKMMRSKNGVREAILLSEILSKPRMLRRS